MNVELTIAQAITVKELLQKEIDRMWMEDYMPRILDKSIENVSKVRKEWEAGNIDKGFSDQESCCFESLKKINAQIAEINESLRQTK